MDADLLAAVEAWQRDDPDPDTVAELDELVAHDDEAGLRASFDAPLTFGTAGLRGPVRAGPGGMNEVTVRRAAGGLCRWLDARGDEGPVVVGRDARHGSAAFVRATAAVVAGSGRQVLVAEGPIPTPLLAFAVRRLGAVAGVMVTASHNPPADNGYKVYAGHGAQIVAPADREIASHMATIAQVRDLPLADPDDSPLVAPWPTEVLDAYLDGVVACRVAPPTPPVSVAYTPMHGVALDVVRQAFARAGIPEPRVVAAQAEPDPDFPTVVFPNPEEPGAMDLLLALAAEHEVDVALANDPDGDRLAMAVPAGGGWRVLTGDELGVLLADHLLTHTAGADRLVATTVVSSSMLAKVAAAHEVEFVETLTGFKWLAGAAIDRPGHRTLLLYEEALGYCIGDLVRDKDGISAAIVAVELVGTLAAAGSSVPQRLAELAVVHGLHRTRQRSLRFAGLDGAERMAAAVDAIRTTAPATLGGVAIGELVDLAQGGALPPTDAVVLRGPGLRVVVRPSGTEPKLKLYVEVVGSVDSPASVPAATDLADEQIDAVLVDLERLLASAP